MERALKSFLDGISDDDNVVNLDHVVKNDNDENEEENKIEVIAQGSSSGMLDMRAMAQRYSEMAQSGLIEEKRVEAPLPGQILRDHLLAPVVETEVEESNLAWLIAGAGFAVLATIVVTAIVTASFVRRSVMAEIQHLRVLPAAMAEPRAEETAGAMAQNMDVAEWPEVDPSLALANKGEAGAEATMQFDESEAIDVTRSREEREARRAARELAAANPVETANPVEIESSTPVETARPVEKPVVTATSSATTNSKGENCDEVLCLVEGRGCCGKIKKSAGGADVNEVDLSLPERLSRADMDTGLKPISGRLNSCGVRHEISGVITLKLKISPEGKVERSSTDKGEAVFQGCVSEILKKANFAKSQKGATLSYPVILR